MFESLSTPTFSAANLEKDRSLFYSEIHNLTQKIIDIFSADLNQTVEELGDLISIIDLLDIQNEVFEAFCNSQIKMYRTAFHRDREFTFENLRQSYEWLKRLLIVYDSRFAGLFPDQWKVDFTLTSKFCKVVSPAIKVHLSSNASTENLYTAIMESVSLQKTLNLRFGNSPAIDFLGVFKPFMFRLVNEICGNISTYLKSFPNKLDAAHFDNSVMLHVQQLFLLFRQGLDRLAKIGDEELLVSLISRYSEHILELTLYINRSMPRYQCYLYSRFLKASSILSDTEIELTCLLLTTIEFAILTTRNLSEHCLKLLIDHEDLPAFDQPIQSLSKCTSLGVETLVKHSINLVQPVFRSMKQIKWSCLGVVGDASFYAKLTQNILSGDVSIATMRRYLVVCPSLFLDISKRFVVSFLGTFQLNLVHCRPVSQIASEQLLVDLQSIKIALFSFGSGQLQHFIETNSSHIAALLKCLGCSSFPPIEFVRNYLLIMNENVSEEDFKHILFLKGIGKARKGEGLLPISPRQNSEYTILLDTYKQYATSNAESSSNKGFG